VRAVISCASVAICASCAMANTVIQLHSYLPSSSNPCFTVMKNGKRASDISLELYQQGATLGKSPYRQSVTNRDGITCLSELPDGKYEIFAKSARRSAELDIDVSKKNEVGGFEIALHLSDQIDAAARTSTPISVQALRGLIQDASGAVMPKAKIEVLRKDGADVLDENPILRTESNQRGQFFCELEKGTYVAISNIPASM
jgi:hypothetical protein